MGRSSSDGSRFARLRFVPVVWASLGLAIGLACGGSDSEVAERTPAPATTPGAPPAGKPTSPSAGKPTSPSAGKPVAPSPTPSPTPSASAAERAATIFETRCATCHGATGQGDGPAGIALNPRPRNLRDPAWQDSVSDEHLETVIGQGGLAVGLSPFMAPNPDLAGSPELLAAMREYVRGLRQ